MIENKMNNNSKNSLWLIIWGVVAVVILPALWFLFCSQADLLDDSTSDVGGKYGHFVQLVFLGLAFSIYCSVCGLATLQKYRYKDKIAKAIYLIGIILFFVTCIIPYDKNAEGALYGYPVDVAVKLGDVHNLLARVTIGFLLIPLLYFQILLLWKNKKFAIVSLCSLAILIGVSIFLIVEYGTCSIVECLLQSYLSIYVFLAYLVEALHSSTPPTFTLVTLALIEYLLRICPKKITTKKSSLQRANSFCLFFAID